MTAQDFDDEIGRMIKKDPHLARIAAAYMDENGPIEKALAQVISSNSKEKNDVVRLFAVWLKLQEEEIRSMGQMLADVVVQLDLKNKRIRTRIESAEYLRLVKKSFRNWSTAMSEMKQSMIKHLLVSAATLRLAPDPVLEIFIDWIDTYTDEHFSVVYALAAARQPMSRLEVWQSMHEHIPAEDSADADMYKLVIHDLTTGHIIRQVREKDYFGRFVRQTPAKRAPTSALAPVLTSAFDDTKPYELTELGKQLVRYVYRITRS
jgi:hypothetical protein